MRGRALAACAALTLGCGEGGPRAFDEPPVCEGSTAAPTADCEPCYCVDGEECRPIFDACAGDEVPVLCGGCLPVGVPRDCWDGFRPDGDGGCEPILPEIDDGDEDDPGCPVGTMPVIGHTECQPVGPPADCWAGWVNDGDGGCEPILPAIDDGDPDDPGCPVGTMPVIGHGECQPVGLPQGCWPGWRNDGDGGCEPILPDDWRDCPDGTIPVIGERECVPLGDCDAPVPAEPGAVFVDASYDGGDADGGAARPYRTIQAGIDAAPAAGQVVVEPGEYVESLTIDKPLRVEGRCALRTIARADRAGARALRVFGSGTEATVRGVTLGGAAGGVLVTLRASATLADLVVRDSGGVGVEVVGGAHLRFARGQVERNRFLGLLVQGSTAEIDDVVVRDTLPRESDGAAGRGLAIQADAGTGQRSEVTIRRSVVAGNREMGVSVAGATATLQEMVVRDTLPRESDRGLGWGIAIGYLPQTGQRSDVKVRRSLVTGNRDLGLVVLGSTATVEETVVRDTLPQEPNRQRGRGVQIEDDPESGQRSEVSIRRSLVLRNRALGVFVWGSTATLEDTAVRDTLPRESDSEQGTGVAIEYHPETGQRSEVSIRRGLVAGNRTGGLLVSGSTAMLEETVVRDTLPRESDRAFGLGIGIQDDLATAERSEASIRRSIVAGNRESGVFVSGSTATIVEAVVRDTLPRESDGAFGRGIGIQAAPATGERSEVTIRRALVSGNRETGVLVEGSAAALEETVVRGQMGRGIQVQHPYGATGRSTVMVQRSLVAGNREAGVFVFGSTAALHETVVRDTVPWGERGRGIFVQVDSTTTGEPADVSIRRSVVAGNPEIGVFASGSAAAFDETVVRDTLGRGIEIQDHPATAERSEASIRRCIVAGNREAGVFVGGSTATLEETVVRDTLPRESDGAFGGGIGILADPATGERSEVTIRRGLVAGNRELGVYVWGSTAALEETVVRGTLPQESDGEFGDGIGACQGGTLCAGFGRSELRVRRSAVAGNARVGLFFYGASGSLSESVVRDNRFAVALERGASPRVAGDNLFGDNARDGVSVGKGLQPAPPIEPLDLSDLGRLEPLAP